jgi:hypothetical protein
MHGVRARRTAASAVSDAETSAATRLAFVPYAPELDERIVDFNRRLAAGRAQGDFRLQVGPSRLLFTPGEAILEERYVAIEGAAVRGGVVLQVQPFRVEGETRTVANMQLPLSEGTVDRRYVYDGMWLIKQVLRRHPYCFASEWAASSARSLGCSARWASRSGASRSSQWSRTSHGPFESFPHSARLPAVGSRRRCSESRVRAHFCRGAD